MNRDKKIATFAFLTIALLSLCCFSPMADSSAETTTSYTIDMRVGDSFSYTVQTNLESDIVATGTAMTGSANGFLAFNSATDVLSGTPATAGTYTAKITATWTSTSGNLTQTASQVITFNIYDRIAITDGNNQTKHILTTATAGSDVFTLTNCYSGPEGTVVETPTLPDGNIFEYTDGKIKLVSGSPTAGTYTITIPFTFAATSDRQVLNLTVIIGTDLVITSPSDIYTFEGNPISYNITTNHDSDGSTVTKTADLSGVSSVSNLALLSGVISGAFGENAVTTGTSKDYTVTIGASGTNNGVAFTTQSKTVTVHVYASLAFTTDPTVGSVKSVASVNSNLDVVISSEIEGAKKITYGWGDGTITVIDKTEIDSSTYLARHVYSTEKTYTITVIAENDVGETRSIIMYDASTGLGTDAVEPVSNDFWDVHGYLWLVLLTVGGILVFAYVRFVQHPIVAVMAAILLGVGIAFYVCDITSFGDAVSELKAFIGLK